MSRRPGDWNCRSCQHYNFSWRDSCQQCGNVRSSNGDAGFEGGHGGSSLSFGVPDVRPGDWHCLCGGHNFASRSNCHSCGTSRDNSAVSISGGGWKSGDWLCTRSGCNQHNFASRRECYRCKTPKGCGT